MKLFLFLLFIFSYYASIAQFVIIRTNAIDTSQEFYVTNTPTNQVGSSSVVSKIKDTTFWRMNSDRLIFPKYASRLDGAPTSILWVDNNGMLKKSNLSFANQVPQLLSINNRTISISNGNSITIPQSNFDSLINKPILPSDFSDSIKYFTQTGIVRQKIKVFSQIIQVTTAESFSINISAAGFNTILNVTATAIKNTSVPGDVAFVSVKQITLTNLILNFVEGNKAVVTLLGFDVLHGEAIKFASISGLSVSVEITGY